MRIAPAGLVSDDPFKLGCKLAAITHGHPSGYLSAGCLAQVIHDVVHGANLGDAVSHALLALAEWPGHEECVAAVEQAVDMARGAPATPESVEQLGEGWVAEEALAISLFCALRAEDLAGGLRLAVNHAGDSDSTGSITGNILGALWGRSAIPAGWLARLELCAEIERIAGDLARLAGGSFGDSEADRGDYPAS